MIRPRVEILCFFKTILKGLLLVSKITTLCGLAMPHSVSKVCFGDSLLIFRQNSLQNIESCIEMMSKEHRISVAEQLDLGDVVDWSPLKLRRNIRSALYSRYEDLEDEEEQLAEFLEEIANTIRDSGFIQPPPGDS